RVVIMSGEVTPPVDADRRFLSQLELTSSQRLACRTHALSDVKVHVPKASLVTDQRLQVDGATRQLQIDQTIRAYEVEVPAPTLHDLRADVERVIDGLETAHGLRKLSAEPVVIRSLSPLARRTEWRLAAYVRSHEIVGFAAPGRRAMGLAVDLGTTKIAGYLVDLETGEELAATGLMNPQIGYGEDVISRLVHADRGSEGAHELARVVRQGLNDLIGTLTDQAGVAREQIAEACIVGNTAMTHLLLKLPVRQLAVSPFVAAASSALDVKARELDLDIAPGAYVHILPGIGGFIGADHVAMIIGSELDHLPHAALGLDIGTNTEIALHRPDEKYLTSASCASGPAFEGAHIRDGMRASTGAIEAMRITDAGITIKTVGDAPAVGLCGSGIIDAIAEMHRTGIIDRRGRIQPAAPHVRRGERGYEMPIVPGARSGTGRDIVITQQDVNEIQLAKGAIVAGLETLIEATHTNVEEIRDVIVAGAFGSYLNLDSALVIGLLPRLPQARYTQVGNAAGVGAKMALLSHKARAHGQQIARRTGYIELTTYPGFNRRFALSMLFPDNHSAALPQPNPLDADGSTAPHVFTRMNADKNNARSLFQGGTSR
ncbi:MAG TPA: ASKHA domain-containing protein, partial [Anaerolineae bacterium]